MGRLTGLDALRGIAALIVLSWHGMRVGEVGDIASGYLAVDFFFALSGYVMARTFESRMPGLTGFAFFRMRYRRFWPTMALGTAIAFPIALIVPNGLVYFALGTAGIPWLAGGSDIFPLNGPAWSLFFELVANALHGFLFYKVGTRNLAIFAAAMGVLTLIASALSGSYANGTGPTNFWFGFPRSLYAYCIGIIAYRTWRDVPPISVHPLITAVALPIVVVLPMPAIVVPFIVPLLCLVLLTGGLRWHAGTAGIAVGALSFPLYALHYPIIRYLAGMHWIAAIAVTLLVCVVFAVALERLRLNRRTETPVNA